ncbi:3'-5' exonuclease [Burkholderia ubonensis]|uniref:3'-5' exonuclease n=1 Tax=Burkholderia ubonensis TaxID=101571 RepID=UPI000B0AE6B0|nr:3'-5' exonuclease [Burkholderia ubonensis]
MADAPNLLRGTPADATAIHGITYAGVADAPDWASVGPRGAAVLADRLLIAHHAAFDERLLLQASRRHGVTSPARRLGCTIELLGEWAGRRIRLADAAQMLGAGAPTTRHRARTDAEQCRQIVLDAARAAPFDAQSGTRHRPSGAGCYN